MPAFISPPANIRQYSHSFLNLKTSTKHLFCHLTRPNNIVTHSKRIRKSCIFLIIFRSWIILTSMYICINVSLIIYQQVSCIYLITLRSWKILRFHFGIQRTYFATLSLFHPLNTLLFFSYVFYSIFSPTFLSLTVLHFPSIHLFSSGHRGGEVVNE